VDENTIFGKVYRRSSFNDLGDLTAHLDIIKESGVELKDKKVVEYEYWEGIELLDRFCEEATQKGAHTLYTFPPFPRSEWVKYAAQLNKLERDLKRDAPCVRFLNSAKDGVLDDKYFFDTVYHLGKEGRDIRTRALIEDLLAAGIR
jgi:hypothetical protein